MKHISLFSLALLYAFSIHAAAELEKPSLALIIQRDFQDNGFGKLIPIPWDAKERGPWYVTGIVGLPNINPSFDFFCDFFPKRAQQKAQAHLEANPNDAYVLYFDGDGKESTLIPSHPEKDMSSLHERVRERLAPFPRITHRVNINKRDAILRYKPIGLISEYITATEFNKAVIEEKTNYIKRRFNCKLEGKTPSGPASAILVKLNRTLCGFGSPIPLDSIDKKPLQLEVLTAATSRKLNCYTSYVNNLHPEIKTRLEENPNTTVILFYDADGKHLKSQTPITSREQIEASLNTMPTIVQGEIPIYAGELKITTFTTKYWDWDWYPENYIQGEILKKKYAAALAAQKLEMESPDTPSDTEISPITAALAAQKLEMKSPDTPSDTEISPIAEPLS